MKPRLKMFAPLFLEMARSTPLEHLPALADSVLRVLVKKGYSRRELRAFLKMLRNARKEREGVLPVTVTTPSGDLWEEEGPLLQALKDCLQKDVQLTKREDPRILGGAYISFGDERIDATLRGSLDRLVSSFHTA